MIAKYASLGYKKISIKPLAAFPMTCSRCQTENPPDSKFCRMCGLRLAETTVFGRLAPRGVPGLNAEIPISEFPFVIGRARQCQLFLNLNSISRQHATIDRQQGRLILSDNGSVNGTFVNGSRITSSPIVHGDRLRIGNADFEFLDPTLAETTPLVKPEESSLAMLLEVAKAINSSLILEDVLQLVMNSVMKVTGSDRGFLLIEEGGELRFSVMRAGDALLQPGTQPKISMSTVNRVFETGIAMVSIDVDSDTHIRSQLSVVSLGLRSIMCVPLKTKNGTLGIIYVDSNRRSKNFTEADLRVLEALADHAAIAIENAQLQKKLLENQRIEQELEFAAIIQRSFLPTDPPALENFRVDARNLSAKTVGGDFYDFLSLNDRQVGVAIGDVSGKGIPAALLMARLLSDFRYLARSEDSPASTLEKINDQLVRGSRRGMFVTMFYLLLDPETGIARCVNAGHLPLLLARGGEVRTLNEAAGVPLGIVPGSQYEEFVLRFEPRDKILLYTDGIIEAIDVHQERFGLKRVSDFLETSTDNATLVESLFQKVQRFSEGAPQHDDMTLVSVERTA